jgi:hypothetical protein
MKNPSPDRWEAVARCLLPFLFLLPFHLLLLLLLLLPPNFHATM